MTTVAPIAAEAALTSIPLRIRYDGHAVAEGRMDARDLAPAMLATAELFQHAAALTAGVNTVVKMEIQADFKKGSFSYEALATGILVGQALLTNLSISDIVVTGTLLIDAVRRAAGRKPKEIIREGDQATIVFNFGPNITVNGNVAQLFTNPTIRKDIEKTVEPLKVEGITDFEITSPVASAKVQRDEIDYFDAPISEEEIVQDGEVTEVVQVLSPDFKVGNKWKFTLAGGSTFWARILDKDFMEKVKAHTILFGSGDALRVRLRIRITRMADGDFERLYEIIEVLQKLDNQPPPSLFDQAS